MECSPSSSSVVDILQNKNTEMGCLFLLQGIFPNQGSNLGLLHVRQILYCLSHQGSSNLITSMIRFVFNGKNREKG